MAQDNRGGYRPTAPQNNTGVSATGGAGSKNGTPQPMRVAPGGKYGERKAMVTQQQGAPMASDMPTAPLPVVHPLTGETGAGGNPVTHGVDFGRGGGSEVLPPIAGGDPRRNENLGIIKKYLPMMLDVSRAPDTPDSFKSFVNYLIGQSQSPNG